jgi:hypothetical protein
MNKPTAVKLVYDQFPIKQTTTLVEKYEFLNYEYGMYEARALFIRGVQTMCKASISIRSWKQRLTSYNLPFPSNRSGDAMFVLEVTATFSTSNGVSQAAFAILYLNGGDYGFWEPNCHGTCICVDGKRSLSLECDIENGNIQMLEDGKGACVSEEFQAAVKKISWSKLAKQVKQEDREARNNLYK